MTEEEKYKFIEFSVNYRNGETIDEKINSILKLFKNYEYYDLKANPFTYTDSYGGGSIVTTYEYILVLKNLTHKK